jgi:alpha-methylacyl-CoA racemase
MSAQRPLSGVRIVELAGLAPAPFAGLVCADFGADVIRIDRSGGSSLVDDQLCRGKRSVELNLKSVEGVAALKRLLLTADVLIDSFRPGVLERLLHVASVNDLTRAYPRLILARLTGFGEPPGRAASARAGHDLNYLAMSGVLSLNGPAGAPPTPPGNLLADFAGGGLSCGECVCLQLGLVSACSRCPLLAMLTCGLCVTTTFVVM